MTRRQAYSIVTLIVCKGQAVASMKRSQLGLTEDLWKQICDCRTRDNYVHVSRFNLLCQKYGWA